MTYAGQPLPMNERYRYCALFVFLGLINLIFFMLHKLFYFPPEKDVDIYNIKTKGDSVARLGQISRCSQCCLIAREIWPNLATLCPQVSNQMLETASPVWLKVEPRY
jgi:hypothetical protein